MAGERRDADRRSRQCAKFARLIRLARLVMGNGRWGPGDLARELECSQRTVFRDIETLSAAGVPVFFDKSDQAYRVTEGFRFVGLDPEHVGPPGGNSPAVQNLLHTARRILRDGETFLANLRQLCRELEAARGASEDLHLRFQFPARGLVVPIPVVCPTCHARTKAPDGAAGRKARCPRCGSAVVVPRADDPRLPAGDGGGGAASPEATPRSGSRRRTRILIAGGIGLVLASVVVGSLLISDRIAENRRQARAEATVRRALDRWCAGESLDQLADLRTDHGFEDPGLTAKMRPVSYAITGVKPGQKHTYEVTATLTFPGGDETRVYEVSLSKDSSSSLVATKAWDDVSGTEVHARKVLRAWLDSWVAGEEQKEFREKHPEAAGQMTADITRAAVRSEGRRLAGYEITNAIPTRKGFRFTVTAMIDGQGSPETKALSYEVFKDRMLSEGRWTIMGN